MTQLPERGLLAVEMRALLTSLFGPKYVAPAAALLGVQEARIKFWCDDKQDRSEHRSSPTVRADLEAAFARRLARGDRLVTRVDQLASAVDYLDDLIERNEGPPSHPSAS